MRIGIFAESRVTLRPHLGDFAIPASGTGDPRTLFPTSMYPALENTPRSAFSLFLFTYPSGSFFLSPPGAAASAMVGARGVVMRYLGRSTDLATQFRALFFQLFLFEPIPSPSPPRTSRPPPPHSTWLLATDPALSPARSASPPVSRWVGLS